MCIQGPYYGKTDTHNEANCPNFYFQHFVPKAQKHLVNHN